MNTEATQITDSILKYIDKVLSGESDYEEFNGNRCSIEIRKDKTLVEDLFEGLYDDFDTFPTYEISTQELRDLIVMWVKKVEEFKKEHGYE
ncbi:hypothetical protein [Fictibacillus gelatini]|uniref:hypothetical protein n=1 Tax=Fictibacillus gelatini TaxID=225985 RepID=UPI0003FBE409|nr:hypothetical protein [Fictibacillus gelatini]